MTGATIYSFADSYTVRAKVAAPLPTEAAIITSPTNQQRFAAQHQTVTGTCPADTYVNLYLQGSYSGTAICGSAGSDFAIDVDLQPGTNDLKARVFNITDDEGPQSPMVTALYDAPASPQTTASTPSSSRAAPTDSQTPAQSPGVTINVDTYTYKTYQAGQTITWTVTMHNGVPPYVLGVDWGDGTQSTYTLADQSPFDISHVYAATDKENKTFTVHLESTDAAGQKSSLQLAAVVNTPITTLPNGTAAKPAVNVSSPLWTKWLWIAWPSYGIVSLMAVSFWLGERQEVFTLLQHHVIRPKRPRHP